MSTEPIVASLLPDTAEITSNDVIIGGVSLRGLAGAYGTPLFVYDEETLRARCREAAGAFEAASRLKPDHPDPLFKLGAAALRLADPTRARKALAASVAIRADHQVPRPTLVLPVTG